MNEKLQETNQNVFHSEQEEDKREPIPTSDIKDLLKTLEDVRAIVLKWHQNQADVSKVGDLFNDNVFRLTNWIKCKIHDKKIHNKILPCILP